MKINFQMNNIQKVFATGGILVMLAYTGIVIHSNIDKKNKCSKKEITYIAPVGYHIVFDDDEPKAILNNTTIPYSDNDIEKIYAVPDGYHIEIIDGNIFAVSNETTLSYDNLTNKKTK